MISFRLLIRFVRRNTIFLFIKKKKNIKNHEVDENGYKVENLTFAEE